MPAPTQSMAMRPASSAEAFATGPATAASTASAAAGSAAQSAPDGRPARSASSPIACSAQT